jgi:NAD(P)-dependent dehydrogenase (short-subunit alcohol dehydrogenase family)
VNADPFSLESKKILVTGASSGIGRQVAVTCAKQGAALVITGRDTARLGETLAALPGSQHRAISADLVDSKQRADLIDQCGAIDGLFFSAGIAAIAPFRMISEKHIDQLMAIDFEAPVMLVQRLLQQRRINDGGSIVFNTAIAVHISPAGSAIYSAAKSALHAAARSLALEVAKNRIRVNCLQLGYVRTPMLERMLSSGVDVKEAEEISPLGFGDPIDAANAAVFLLSDASRWISRTTLTADGGISIRVSH